MPPKKDKKSADSRVAEDLVHHEEREESVASKFTVGRESESTCFSSETLERILAANAQTFLAASKDSMSALLAALPSPSAAHVATISDSVTSTTRAHIKTPKWTDEETPFEYFTKYEKAMTHNRVPKGEWCHLLPVYLSGKAQASFTQVPEDMLDDLDTVKQVMLEALGDTPSSADRRWWTMTRQSGEDPGAFYLRERTTGLRYLQGLMTREEILERTILSRFMSLLPQDCYSFVAGKNPKNGLEAARQVQEFEETRGFAKRQQPWRHGYQANHGSGQRTQPSAGRGPSENGYRRSSTGNGERSGSDGSVGSNGGNGRNASSQEQPSGRQASGGRHKSDNF